MAEQHYRHGRLSEALGAYASLCSQEPEDAQAWHMQGAICGMLGQYRGSAACYERAIALAPDVPALYSNYANALIELSRYDDALSAMKKAAGLDPADTGNLALLGKLSLLTGDQATAETYFRQVFRSSPDNAAAANSLARLLADSGRIGGRHPWPSRRLPAIPVMMIYC
jgi:tetratricopeptide (TPR) repeat protein